MFETGRKISLCECKGCFYWRRLGSDMACHYAIDTKDVRGIKPTECYKHEGTPYMTVSKGKKAAKKSIKITRRKKEKSEIMAKQTYPREVREAAVKAVLVDKEPSEVVRERYCIAKSTLGKWITEAKREQAKYFAYADSIHLPKTGQDSGLTAQSVVTEKDGTEDMAKEDIKQPYVADDKTKVVEAAQPATEVLAELKQEDAYERRCVTEDRTPAEIMWDAAEEFECVVHLLDENKLIRSDEKQMLEIIHARCSGFALGLEYGGK